MEAIRTFIALELPEELKKSLGRFLSGLRERAPGVKWVRPESIHLTLKFLGDIGADAVPAVGGALESASRGAGAFSFEAAGIGAFPNSRNPKVVWAGMRIDDRLREFQQLLDAALAGIGIAREERPFAPHVTLGRLRDGRARKSVAELIERHGAERFGRFTADRLVFFKSELKPAGPVHEPLKIITLPKTA